MTELVLKIVITNGETIDIEIESADLTIIELKYLVFLKTNISIHIQEIICQGKILSDLALLKDVNSTCFPMHLKLCFGKRFNTELISELKIVDSYYLSNSEHYSEYNKMYQEGIELYYKHLVLKIKLERLLISNSNLIDSHMCEYEEVEKLKNNIINKLGMFVKFILTNKKETILA